VTFETWQAFYASDLQSLWSLLPVSLATLVALLAGVGPRTGGAVPSQAPLVRRFALLFAAISLADALATTVGLRVLGWSDTRAGLAVVIAFVLIGDFRVFLLLFALGDAGVRRLRDVAPRAAAWTLLVPASAISVAGAIRLVTGAIETVTIWLLYELFFLALAVALRQVFVPEAVDPEPPARRAWLRTVLGFVALYYALWASADVLTAWLGLDLGWALRALPNQLYYSLFVPFVWLSFFARRYAAASASAQASR
jgi:hypothetical protein